MDDTVDALAFVGHEGWLSLVVTTFLFVFAMCCSLLSASVLDIWTFPYCAYVFI